MKKTQKKEKKKLSLNRETLNHLQQVTGGAYYAQIDQQASGGPEICWFSDCNACDSNLGC